MAVRWASAAFLDAEKGYRRIMGYKNLWILCLIHEPPPAEVT